MTRVADSLLTLRDQVNAQWPNRDKASDGFWGDARHQAQASDHNANAEGVCCAFDITHDPVNGPDIAVLFDLFRNNPQEDCKYCLAPSTRVLTADLRWEELGLLLPGDKLLAFDEFSGDNTRSPAGAGGQFRTATVEALQHIRLSSLRLFTERGEIISSADHLWLVERGHGQRRRWVATSDLTPGDEIRYFADPWTEERDSAAGWLGGLFDGEGCLSSATKADRKNSWVLSVAQRPGLVMDRAIALLNQFGISFTQHQQKGGCHSLNITGGFSSLLEVLGRFPTVRLRDKAISNQIWEGRRIGPGRRAQVKHVELAGKQDLVMIQTSTRTLIADGYFSHNCIANGQIASRKQDWTARPYSGDPHTNHIHVSVGVGSDGHSAPGTYDSRQPWTITAVTPPNLGEEDVTFIAEFLDPSLAGRKYLVTPWASGGPQPGRYGVKVHITNPEELNNLLAANIPDRGKIPGGGYYKEVA